MSDFKRPTGLAKDDRVLQELQQRYREWRETQTERQLNGAELTPAEQVEMAAAFKAYLEHVSLRGELGGL
jgi:hypothetical protein